MSLTTVALAGALVGPPLLLASATQIQAQRTQQAQRLAQAEIDRVRSLVRQSAVTESAPSDLPPVSAAAKLAQQPPPQAIAAVQSTHAHCRAGRGALSGEAIGIDIDGDTACDPEFVLQRFRSGSSVSRAPFEVMVRVYAASNQDFAALQTEIAPVGLGQVAARRPLAVITTTISPSDAPGALLCYHGQRCAE
ncbi:MAG: hypothetical protein ACFB5Z_18565 [Elainellaceae cyanobacterium]